MREDCGNKVYVAVKKGKELLTAQGFEQFVEKCFAAGLVVWSETNGDCSYEQAIEEAMACKVGEVRRIPRTHGLCVKRVR